MNLDNLHVNKNRIYTTDERFKVFHRSAVAGVCAFIILICTFICIFAFAFRKKTTSYYGELADTRIRNTAAETEKSFDLSLKECFLDLSHMESDIEDEDFTTGGVTDYDKIHSFMDSLYGYIIKDFGVIYDKEIHMDKSESIPFDFTISENEIYVQDSNVYFISRINKIDGIDGIVGRMDKKAVLSMIATEIFENEASILVLNSSSDEILVSSGKFSDIFTGNLITDVSEWYQGSEKESLDSFIKSEGIQTIDIGSGDWNVLMYKNETEYMTESGPLIFLMIVPKARLTNQLVDLTYISLTALYATLTIFSILLIVLFILYMRMYLSNLRKTESDSKTGLLNEMTFFHDAIALLLKNSSEYAIVTMNINNFKRINALYGTVFADEVLISISDVLKEYFRDSKEDIVGYQHADNYLLFLKGNKEEVLYKIENLKSTLLNYNSNMNITFTFGVKMTDSRDATELHKEFDCAKFAEKIGNSTDGIYFYDEEMFKKQEEENTLISRFDQALENREFEVYFQLKWDLTKNDWGGCEALVRWHDPERGLISPGRFIPLFEDNGYITRLDLYVFEAVCEHLSQMLDNGERCVKVSFNLSKRNFADLSFIPVYEKIVEKYNIPHDLLEFEITEGLLMDNVSAYQEFIATVHESHYSISMDDFGAGYSSLNMIHQLDFDVIKIDAKFFRGGLDDSNKTIVDTIIQLCHKLGKIVVAEGIEQPNEVDFLRSCGCDLIQGYYFAKPLPYDDFKMLLHKNEEN